MAKIYLETSLVSYLVALPSRNPLMAARQQLTIEWWDKERSSHDLYASDVVLREARQADPNEAAKRLAVLNGLQMLKTTEAANNLALLFIERHALPEKAAADALHIAIAAVDQMDYLLTWNCKHIANAMTRKAIEQTCMAAGYQPPTISTLEAFGV